MKTLLSTFLILVLSIDLTAQTATLPAGSGTSGDPYQIATLNNLYWITQNAAQWSAGKYFRQTANIDATSTSSWHSGKGLSPIGNATTAFYGVYDGNNYAISNLTIARSATVAEQNIGLFGYLEAGAQLKNIGLTSANVNGYANVGALAGFASGSGTIIENCYVIGGTVKGNFCAGGLAGTVTTAAIVRYCFSNNTINNLGTSGQEKFGGLIGYIDSYSFPRAFAINSYSRSIVNTGVYGTLVGGLIGANDGSQVDNCYSTGAVTGSSSPTAYVSGLVGGAMEEWNGQPPVFNNCFFDAQTSGKSIGVQDVNYQEITGAAIAKTTAQMKTLSTFTSAGWDFVGETTNGTNDYWHIVATENNGYPHLYWQAFAPPPPVITSFSPISAAVGETVTISGDYFTGASAVSFGGVSATSFTVVNANTITAVVGNGNSGSVSVTTANGTGSLAGFSMVYTWLGTSGNAWNNPANWSPAIVPASGADIVFGAALNDLVLDQNRTVDTVTFSNSNRKLVLGTYTLTAKRILGNDNFNYVQTNGSGALKINILNTETVTFPVGNSTYNPLVITNNTGAADNFTTRVLDEVYDGGLVGNALISPRVQRTWDISKTTANAGSGVNLTFNWNSNEAINISTPLMMHYQAAAWVPQTGSVSSTSTSLTYTGYNGSFSPFAIYSECQPSSSTDSVTVCSTQLPYNWNGNDYNAAGTYNITLPNSIGCDSVVTLVLDVVSVLQVGSITGPNSVCAYMGALGDTATYSVTATNAATYTWAVTNTSTMTIVSGQGTSSIRVKYASNFTTGNVNLRVTSSTCGNPINRTMAISRTVPSTPAAILGPNNACPYVATLNTVTYTASTVANALYYHWTLPATVTIVSASNDSSSISILFNAGYAASIFKVRAVSGCGSSADRSLTVGNSRPVTPARIYGPTDACPYVVPDGGDTTGRVAFYWINKVNGAASYNWTFTTGGATIVEHPGGQGTLNDTIVRVVFSSSFTSTQISVTASSACGTSNYRTLTISRKVPGSPGAITVTELSACPNRSIKYSIAAVANATGYVWTVPAAATLNSGQGTTEIIVSYPSGIVSGSVTVAPVNNCYTVKARTLPVRLVDCNAPVGTARTINTERTIVTNASAFDVQVSPNPSQFDFTFSLQGNSGKAAVSMKLTDVNGRIVYTNQQLLTGQTFSTGADLRPGIYFAEFTSGTNKRTVKLLKL